MADLALLVKAWDTAHWELGEAFKGLQDGDVWVRPHPRLLSIGENVAHLAYWEALKVGGDKAESPLREAGARYYSTNVDAEVKLDFGADALCAEHQRLHKLAKEVLLSEAKDSEDPCPYHEGATWGEVLEYQVFHVAYHTGQIYSVRHLMGHETVDN